MGKPKGSAGKPATEPSPQVRVPRGRDAPKSVVEQASLNVSATRPEPRPPSRPEQPQRRPAPSEPNRPGQTGKETRD